MEKEPDRYYDWIVWMSKKENDKEKQLREEVSSLIELTKNIDY